MNETAKISQGLWWESKSTDVKKPQYSEERKYLKNWCYTLHEDKKR